MNCKGVHVSSAAACPLRACAMERRKTLMECRLEQQLKVTHPSAEVETIDLPAHAPSPSSTTEVNQTSSTATQSSSYASAVRSMIVGPTENPAAKIHLPGPTPIPKRKHNRRQMKPIPRKKTTSRRNATSKIVLTPLKIIEPIIKILDSLCPEAANRLRGLITSLRPLLNMLSGLSGKIGNNTEATAANTQ